MSEILVDRVRAYTGGAAGTLDLESNVIIRGDVTIEGTRSVLNSVDLEVTDQNILVNKGGNDASAQGAGLTVERTGTNGQLVYDSVLASKWKCGDLGALYEIIVSGIDQNIDGNKNLLGQIEIGETGEKQNHLIRGDIAIADTAAAISTDYVFGISGAEAVGDPLLLIGSNRARNNVYYAALSNSSGTNAGHEWWAESTTNGNIVRRMTLNHEGNLGVGESDPISRLHLNVGSQTQGNPAQASARAITISGTNDGGSAYGYIEWDFTGDGLSSKLALGASTAFGVRRLRISELDSVGTLFEVDETGKVSMPKGAPVSLDINNGNFISSTDIVKVTGSSSQANKTFSYFKGFQAAVEKVSLRGDGAIIHSGPYINDNTGSGALVTNTDVSNDSSRLYTGGDLHGLTGGVAGQFLNLRASNASSAVTLIHNSGSGTQPFLLPGNANRGYSSREGCLLYCTGTFWIVVADSQV